MRRIIILNVVILLSLALNAQISKLKGENHLQEDTLTWNAFSSVISNDISLPQTIPPAPNAAALAMYADHPVSHYTGVPNISIPLYEINIDGYTLPITANYHASGIRVNQEASWIGLGWSLSAGGMVSRTLKCYDDFLEYPHSSILGPKGYFYEEILEYPFYQYLEPWSGNSLDRYRLKVDAEPDVFYYSLPDISGKFILDKTRGPLLFEKAHNIKVEVKKNTLNKITFVITSAEGIEYHFEEREITKTYSVAGALNDNSDNAEKLDDDMYRFDIIPLEHASSWYLSKIITRNKREITFNYETEIYSAPAQQSKEKNTLKKSEIWGVGDFSKCYLETYTYSLSKSVHTSQRLTKITWDGGYIEFESSGREDMTGEDSRYLPEKLDRMHIYDKKNNYRKGFEFIYEYFNDKKTGKYAYVFKRLKLKGIKELGNKKTYVNNGHVFTYFEGDMPAKNSNNTDYWGYHNGKKYGSDYYASYYDGEKVYTGADKSSNFTYMKIGTLNEIKYPTGESALFVYEPHLFKDPASGKTTIKTKNWSFEVYNSYEENEYPHLEKTGKIEFTVPVKAHVKITGYINNFICKKDEEVLYEQDLIAQLTRKDKYKEIYKRTMPLIYGDVCDDYVYFPPLNLEAGTYVFEAYCPPKDVIIYWKIETDMVESETVEPEYGAGLRIAEIKTGDKVRKFTYQSGVLLLNRNFGRIERNVCLYGISGTAETYYAIQSSQPSWPLTTFGKGNSVGYSTVEEFMTDSKDTSRIQFDFYCSHEERLWPDLPSSPTEINYMNGLIKEKKYYENKREIQRIKYRYHVEYAPYPLPQAFLYPSNQNKETYDYTYSIEWPMLQEEEINTFIENPKKTILEEKYYKYNDYLQLSSVRNKINNVWYEQKNFYPVDYPNDNMYKKLVDKNIISQPVEVVNLRGEYITSATKTTYKDTLGLCLPDKVLSLAVASGLTINNYISNYKDALFFDVYNEKGQLLQARAKDNVPVTYIWAYNYQYPVAEILNATYDQVKKVLGKELLERIGTANTPAANDMKAINNLRENTEFKNAQINTYEYEPLVGRVKYTDARGVVVSYDYDEFSRLEIVKDAKNKVMEYHRYHFQE